MLPGKILCVASPLMLGSATMVIGADTSVVALQNNVITAKK